MGGRDADLELPELALADLVIEDGARVEHTGADGGQGRVLDEDSGCHLGGAFDPGRPREFAGPGRADNSFDLCARLAGRAGERDGCREFDIRVRLLDEQIQRAGESLRQAEGEAAPGDVPAGLHDKLDIYGGLAGIGQEKLQPVFGAEQPRVIRGLERLNRHIRAEKWDRLVCGGGADRDAAVEHADLLADPGGVFGGENGDRAGKTRFGVEDF